MWRSLRSRLCRSTIISGATKLVDGLIRDQKLVKKQPIKSNLQLTPAQGEASRCGDRCDSARCDRPRRRSHRRRNHARDDDSSRATRARRHCSPFAERPNGLRGERWNKFLEFIDGREKTLMGEFYCVEFCFDGIPDYVVASECISDKSSLSQPRKPLRISS